MTWTRLAEFAGIGSFVLALFFGLLQTWPQIKAWPMSNWRAIFFLVFLFLGVIFSAVQYAIPRFVPTEGSKETSQGWEQIQKKEVSNRTFRNERVPLDGYSYIGCTFENVIFEYKGEAPFSMRYNTIRGRRIVSTANSKPLAGLIGLLRAVEALKPDFELLGEDPAHADR